MVDISTLKVGDRVRIVDEWVVGCRENSEGKMDRFLGQVVRVGEIRNDGYNGSYFHIPKEDLNAGEYNWFFYSAAIQDVVFDEYEDGDNFQSDALGDPADFLSSVYRLMKE